MKNLIFQSHKHSIDMMNENQKRKFYFNFELRAPEEKRVSEISLLSTKTFCHYLVTRAEALKLKVL